jgi:outer membrane protein assembly factor BamB
LSDDEKILYIGTSSGLFGNHQPNQVFDAIDVKTGKEIWRLQLGMNEVRSSPAVASDNSIFISVETRDPANGSISGDELWHISSEGDLLSKYNINPNRLTIEVGQSSPATGSDGTIYVAGDKLYAINPDGSLRCAIFGSTNEVLRNAPVIGTDGTLKWKLYHVMNI